MSKRDVDKVTFDIVSITDDEEPYATGLDFQAAGEKLLEAEIEGEGEYVIQPRR